MEIHEELKKMRQAAGLTQDQMAQKLGKGYKKHIISDLERGVRNIGLAVLGKWLDACGRKIDFPEK